LKKTILQDGTGTFVAYEFTERSKSSDCGAVGFDVQKTSRKVVVSAYEIIPSNLAGRDELEKLNNGRHDDNIDLFLKKRDKGACNNQARMNALEDWENLKENWRYIVSTLKPKKRKRN